MGKVVPINFCKRAVIQFKMVKNVRNANGQVVGQREVNITKVFKPSTTLYDVMKFVIDKSDSVAEGCLMIFETDNPEVHELEDEGTEEPTTGE